MKSGGEDEEVTIHNVDEYVERTLDWCLNRGVYRQLEALRAGLVKISLVTERNYLYFFLYVLIYIYNISYDCLFMLAC